jgi:hypothetical protein
MTPGSVKNKPNDTKYWIIGRRKLKLVNEKKNKNNLMKLGDFFICTKDDSDNILMELEFNKQNFD